MQKNFIKFVSVSVWLFFILHSAGILAQSVSETVVLTWKTDKNKEIYGKTLPAFLSLNQGMLNQNLIPEYIRTFPLNGSTGVKINLKALKFTSLTQAQVQNSDKITNSDFTLNWELTWNRKNPYARVVIQPLRKVNGRIERLDQFDIVIISDNNGNVGVQKLSKKGGAAHSVLANGAWYKLNVTETGIQKVTPAMLKTMGIDPNTIDPRSIKIYGNGPGALPFENSAYRNDDLWENPIEVQGESDGRFDESDAIYFYGKSQNDVWYYDKSSSSYIHLFNPYTEQTVYFLTFGGANGKRITTIPSQASNANNDGHYDRLYFYEKDNINLIKSGRRWFGEEFGRELTYEFNVNMGNLDPAFPVFFRSGVVARAFSPSSFDVWVNGNYVFNQGCSSANPDFEFDYATENLGTKKINVTGGNLSVRYTYNQSTPVAQGWLDYFELQSRNYLTLPSGELLFSDIKSVDSAAITKFSIPSPANTRVWDVTRSFDPVAVQTNYTGSNTEFTAATDSLKEFLVFDGTVFHTPGLAGYIVNQDLHGLPFADMFIVSHESFLSEANKIAELRRNQGLSVNVVSLNQVFNEFSSGVQDISAIRDMMRMFYKRASNTSEMPKYLLLFGRASYDYKSRIKGNTNFVPTFESWNSFVPVYSYCSDDYFGILDDNEGLMLPGEMLDISIGRIPATNAENAAVMTNKILNYSTSQDWGDWKNRLVFVADDEDGNLHEYQSDGHAEKARNNYKNYNVQKIYIDAFKEETTAGGARNPIAQAEIVRAVERGALMVNYTGHGGEVGWAAERILNTDDIQNWTNGKKLPMFFTATCEFSRFDDAERISAGEYVFMNPNGGSVGMFTTVRLVDAGNNNMLNTAFYKYAGLDSTSAFNRLRLGDIMRSTKNDVLSDNSRNFTLLGDPSMYLAYPDLRVYTTSVNNVPIGMPSDTLKAFSLVTISGVVTDLNKNPKLDFNGLVYPTVFDKVSVYTTVVNNPDVSSPFNFNMQNNVIYRGSATVKNGAFTFSFIVPKDIGYQIGNGKISYYAENGITDAHGYDESILVGGTSDSAGVDKVGPEVKLYLNDENFVFGGLTNENPLFIAKMKDATGINITGVGVGRELSLTLNNDNTSTTSMNDFYRAKTDSYREGEVRFPLKGMKAGKNSVRFGAWDVYNNYSESVLEFVVAGSAEMALQHVLNYPNPFTTNTTFHFDHNKPGQDIKVQVQIFTVSGKLIKNLQTETVTTGNHFDQLTWDGKDEYGDQIAKGVYVYKVKVKSGTGKAAEEFQKLVILN